MLKRLLLFVLCVVLAGGVIYAQAPPKGHRVVFVISAPDTDDWHSGMLLSDHFRAGVKPEKSDIEVLAYGGGISVLKKGSPEAKYIGDLEKQGVHFVACENAMKAFNIKPEDLLPGVSRVPSGVVELVRKQEAGWSYVKVGK